MTWYRVGKRNTLVKVEQDPKKLDFIATMPRGAIGRGDTIEEAVDNVTGVGR